MAYPQTLTDLQNDVLSRLAETSASHAGDLPTGVGGAPTIDTLTTIAQYLNEGGELLARTCYPIADSGTIASFAPARFASFTALTVSSGSRIWAARGATWNGVALTYCSRSALELNFPTWETDAAAPPVYWFPQGEDGIGLYPLPNATHALVVDGLAVPARLSSGGNVPSWLQPDLAKLLVFYAAAQIAKKNDQNPEMQHRAALWEAELERARQALLARLWATDPALARAHFPAPAA